VIDLDIPSDWKRYIETFCINIAREKYALEQLFLLEKQGKVVILNTKDYSTPKGYYFVVVEFECEGENPVAWLAQATEDELKENEEEDEF